MKLIVAWFRTYWKSAALCGMLIVGFVMLHLLGGGQVQEIRYALMLALLICAFAFCVSLFSLRGRLKALEKTLLMLPGDALYLSPEETPVGELYQSISAAYLKRAQGVQAEAAARHREAEDYFTLWLHQMKTPLSALDLMAQSDAPVDKPLMRQELLKARQYADMALTYQRLPSMSEDLELEQVPLYPLCCSCVKGLMPLFRYGRIALDMEPFDGGALTDAKWLGAVITQVLTNSLKYTPPGGRIAIGMKEPGVLTVADNGIGIRPEDVPRVFERGFTGFAGRVHEKSTGIGLYLCREIMSRLGHKIALSSEVGQGTVVRLDLRRSRFQDMG